MKLLMVCTAFAALALYSTAGDLVKREAKPQTCGPDDEGICQPMKKDCPVMPDYEGKCAEEGKVCRSKGPINDRQCQTTADSSRCVTKGLCSSQYQLPDNNRACNSTYQECCGQNIRECSGNPFAICTSPQGCAKTTTDTFQTCFGGEVCCQKPVLFAADS